MTRPVGAAYTRPQPSAIINAHTCAYRALFATSYLLVLRVFFVTLIMPSTYSAVWHDGACALDWLCIVLRD